MYECLIGMFNTYVLYVCMHPCTYVCMGVCVCVYVCLIVCMGVVPIPYMYVCAHACHGYLYVDGCMHAWVYPLLICMYVYVHACIWMYTCVIGMLNTICDGYLYGMYVCNRCFNGLPPCVYACEIGMVLMPKYARACHGCLIDMVPIACMPMLCNGGTEFHVCTLAAGMYLNAYAYMYVHMHVYVADYAICDMRVCMHACVRALGHGSYGEDVCVHA
jgi:hypothetical protein